MTKSIIKLNVIDRKGKKTTIETEEGTTIRDAIDNNLQTENYGICGGECACGSCQVHVEPKDFKIMVKKIREIELAIGKVTYNISKSSKKNLNSRRSIYVSKQINKGGIISKDNIRVVRPSFGLHPKFFKKILGKKVNRKLMEGTRLNLNYIIKKN